MKIDDLLVCMYSHVFNVPRLKASQFIKAVKNCMKGNGSQHTKFEGGLDRWTTKVLL